MKWTIGSKIGAGFTLSVLALLVISALAFQNTRRLTAAAGWVSHTHQVLEKLSGVNAAIKDAETGQRGFLLTGDETYLEPYTAGSQAVLRHLEELRGLTADNANQQARLRLLTPLIEAKLAELKGTIDLRRDPTQGPEAALAALRSGRGKATMDGIRQLAREIQGEELLLLEARNRENDRGVALATTVMLGSAAAAAALLALVGLLITRNIAGPLQHLTTAAEKIASGELEVQIEHRRRSDEVGLLSQAFRRMAASLQQMARHAEQVAEGNLLVQIKPQSAQDVLGTALVAMVQRLSSLIGQVQRSGIQVSTSTTEIAATARQQQATASQVSATTVELGATAKEISATSQELVKSMQSVTGIAAEAASLAGSGQSGLSRMEKTMRQITEASGAINARLTALSEKAGHINTVVTTITKVADQTNLLSLNAAIEAEKAGEYGRGFAVVASEIRRLADQTAEATSDIEQIVQEMQSAVSAGVMGMDKFSEEIRQGGEVVTQVSAQLAEIIGKVQTLTPSFETVDQGMRSQAQAAGQISDALVQLSEAAQQTVESLRQSNAAIEQLTQVTAGLQSGVARFKV